MTAVAHHTFNGAAYKPGDTYDVVGDSTQTADQYADTLTALQFATRVPLKAKAAEPKPKPDTASPPPAKK